MTARAAHSEPANYTLVGEQPAVPVDVRYDGADRIANVIGLREFDRAGPEGVGCNPEEEPRELIHSWQPCAPVVRSGSCARGRLGTGPLGYVVTINSP